MEVGDRDKDYDIWRMHRMGDGWSEPENLGSPVNTGNNEFYPSLTRDGTLFVTAQYQPGTGEDIYRIPFSDGQYGTSMRLSDAINSPLGEYNAFVAPDESYLIFSTTRQNEGSGSGELYISFRGDDGVWTPAKNMGPVVNSPALDYCPYVTPDGKYLFFSSNRTIHLNQTGKITYDLLKQEMNTLGNGDIFWISASIIEKYR